MKKNAILDAIRNMKSKRVAIVIADADDLSASDEQNNHADSEAETEGEEMSDDTPMHEMTEDDSERESEGETAPPAAAAANTDAEKVLGRKPFEKTGQAPGEQAASGVDQDVARDLFDSNLVDRIEQSGRKPRGLFERGQMALARRMKR
jgi:hypothetical protein